ncbi:DMT(drug/metabolite transporter) superfamily permease [Leptolyngbyaceae cyanobacterium JSC-12]|nr:DMT(drug/metabolite transporter) superfamily permease [Leptolyngbyaceae cyanobacterium JSC-12]
MQHSTQSPNRPASRTPAIATLLALCIALVSISSAAIFIKISEQEINPYATAFNRFWITTVVLAGWSGVRAIRERSKAYYAQAELLQSPSSQGLPVGQLFLIGLFLSGDLMLWAWSLTQTSVANATLLANLTPIFSCLVGWLICRKRFDRQFIIGMAIAIAAIFAIGLGDCQSGISKFQGDLAALIAAISFSVYLFILERLQSRLNALTIVMWSSALATLITLPVALLSGGHLFPTSWQGWLTIISLAGVCQILGQGMLVYSLNQMSSEFVALSLLLEPVFAGMGAWLLFSESLSMMNLAAFAIALAGVFLSLSSPSAMRDTALSVATIPETAEAEEILCNHQDAIQLNPLPEFVSITETIHYR